MFVVTAVARGKKIVYKEKFITLDEAIVAYMIACATIGEYHIVVYKEDTGELIDTNIR